MSVAAPQKIRLDEYVHAYAHERSWLLEGLWLALHGLAFSSWLPGSGWRAALLRAFGARIGRGVVIKPRVRVKQPWRLVVGDHAWIGEAVWIDNLDTVTIGDHCCLSQGAYLCTGNHDWSDPRFALVTAPIVIAEGSWIAARATVGPGVRVGRLAVLTVGSVALADLPEAQIWRGNPAVAAGVRRLVAERRSSYIRNNSAAQSSAPQHNEPEPWRKLTLEAQAPSASASPPGRC